MPSEWRVTSNVIDGRKVYGVYRLIDPGEINHSGNREIYDGYTESRGKAEALARRLNERE